MKTADNPSLRGALLFDWGDTLMRVFPDYQGPMHTWPRLELMPSVEKVLPELHKHWVIALATNAVDSDEKNIRLALETVKISGFIDHIYCFRKIGSKKPSKEFFKYIIDDLRTSESKLIMIGDDVNADVLGAAQAGISAIWYNPSGNCHPGKITVPVFSDFNDLPVLLSGYK